MPPYEAIFAGTLTVLAILLGVFGLLLNLHDTATTLAQKDIFYFLISGTVIVSIVCAVISLISVHNLFGGGFTIFTYTVGWGIIVVLLALPIGLTLLFYKTLF